MNCGRKASRKIASFGFRAPTAKPSQNSRRSRALRGAAASATAPTPSRSARMPSQIRYTAPMYLTIVNAVADEATIAARPTVAASTST